jgi:hypothetical protein
MAVKASAKITLTRVDDGATGPAGKGIKSTSITYQAGTSGTTAPTGAWSTNVPSVPQGQYLWSKTVITYTDNTTSTTYSVAYIPKNGQNGATGGTGTGVENIVQQYYLSTSKTTQTGGSWVTSMPTWSSGKYLWTRYQINYKNPTSTAYTSPICDSSWEAVNDIQVGGRNLALDTNKGVTGWNWAFANGNGCRIQEEVDIDGVRAVKFTRTDLSNEGTWGSVLRYTSLNLNLLEADTSYVISFDILPSFSQVFSVCIVLPNGTSPISTAPLLWSPVKSNVWNRILFNVKTLSILPEITEQCIQFSRIPEDTGTTFTIKNLKLEKGNKATDWTPSPEDMATNEDLQDTDNTANDALGKIESTEDRVTITESELQILKDSISTMVTDENGTSLMTQKGDGWTFNMGSINKALDNTASALNDAVNDINDTASLVSSVKDVVDSIEKKTAYITMSTDDTGTPCIELGKADNPFKLRITNTSVDFLENGTKIAYVSNQTLYIERAIIKNELQIGDGSGFIWRKRENGNLGLRWTGG